MSDFQLPKDHQPGIRVPKGGSSCASCEYYKGGMKCGNKYFIKWNGSDKIPAKAPDEYCSDWYEPLDAALSKPNTPKLSTLDSYLSGLRKKKE